jgi:hypothetical protein
MKDNLSVKLLTITVNLHQTVNQLQVQCNNHQATSVTASLQPCLYQKTFCIQLLPEEQIVTLVMQGIQDNDTIVDSQNNIVDSAVFEIENIWIDGIMIEKWAISNMYKFFPEYSHNHIEYAEKNNSSLRTVIQNEWKFFFNGVWQLDVDNFFVNYNYILTNGLSKYNYWAAQGALGFVENTKLNELKGILDSL